MVAGELPKYALAGGGNQSFLTESFEGNWGRVSPRSSIVNPSNTDLLNAFKYLKYLSQDWYKITLVK